MYKNKRILKVTNIILIIIVCILSIFIIYDKFIKKEEKIIIPEPKKEEIKEEIIEKVDPIIIGQRLNTNVGTFIIEKEGNVIYNPSNYLFDMNPSYRKSNLSKTSLGEMQEIELKDNNNELIKIIGYKLDFKDIIEAYEIHFGDKNEYKTTIMFIDKDNLVSYINFAYSNEVMQIKTVHKMSKYKDIISIIKTSDNEKEYALLIDKNNNQYILESIEE